MEELLAGFAAARLRVAVNIETDDGATIRFGRSRKATGWKRSTVRLLPATTRGRAAWQARFVMRATRAGKGTPRLVHREAALDLREGGALRLVLVADTHGHPHPDSARHIAAARPDAILHAGDLLVLSGFGAGLTWGTALMRW